MVTFFLFRNGEKIMFCPNCGKEINEGSRFCAFCGFKLITDDQIPLEDVIRNVIIHRIDGIKNRDAKAVEALVIRDKYSKFDDWPPFDLQGQESLKSEADALKVLKDYDYETRTWRITIFGDSAIAAFIIRYHGQMRDLAFNVQSRVTVFLTKQDGEWRIVHEHWSRFPAPQQPPAAKAPDQGKSDKTDGPIVV